MMAKQKGRLLLDIQNLGNLLNSRWGTLQQVPFPYVAPVVDVRYDPTTQRYVLQQPPHRAPGSGQPAPLAVEDPAHPDVRVLRPLGRRAGLQDARAIAGSFCRSARRSRSRCRSACLK